MNGGSGEWRADGRRVLGELHAAGPRGLPCRRGARARPTLDVPLRRLSRSANNSKLWFAIAAALFAFGGRRGRRAAVTGSVAIGLNSLIVNQPLKRLGRRERPDRATDEAAFVERHVAMPTSTSFPSGHSASGFAFAQAVAAWIPGAGFPLRALAAVVAYSRVHTGVHYPGDVLAGVLIGMAVGEGTARGARRLVKSGPRARAEPRGAPPTRSPSPTTARPNPTRDSGKAPRPAGPRGLSVASRKPDPVVGDHPSGTHVAARLMRPEPGSLGRATLKHSPIWPCTGRGLPSRPVTRTAGELLPHRFTLTRTSEEAAGGLLSVALSLGFPRLAVSQRPALRCPDFPRRVPRGLRTAARRGPDAATWLASGVYHRGRRTKHRCARRRDDEPERRRQMIEGLAAPARTAATCGAVSGRAPGRAAPARRRRGPRRAPSRCRATGRR